MYGNYLMLCGMVWAQFGKEDAGMELIRALASDDPDVRVLARTLLGQSACSSKQLIVEALLKNEISADTASVCGFGLQQSFRENPWGKSGQKAALLA